MLETFTTVDSEYVNSNGLLSGSKEYCCVPSLFLIYNKLVLPKFAIFIENSPNESVIAYPKYAPVNKSYTVAVELPT